MVYTQLVTILQAVNSTKSPVVFSHGFPDSRLMFREYFSEMEQQRAWLKGRSIFAIEFPNRQTNSEAFPTLSEMKRGILVDEYRLLMNQIVEEHSPTNQIIPIAHDLGCTYTWQYIRDQGGEKHIEFFVSLSVGSSFRYDVWDLGIGGAFTWPFYRVLFGLSYYLPIFCPTLASLLSFAGYKAKNTTDAPACIDAYHYWDGWIFVLLTPFRFFVPQQDYTSFPFPVLYIRCPADRIASNAAFERTIQLRENSRMVVYEDAQHWFPEQESSRVLAEIRFFFTGLQ